MFDEIEEPSWVRGFRLLCEMDGFDTDHLTVDDIEKIMHCTHYYVQYGRVLAPTVH